MIRRNLLGVFFVVPVLGACAFTPTTADDLIQQAVDIIGAEEAAGSASVRRTGLLAAIDALQSLHPELLSPASALQFKEALVASREGLLLLKKGATDVAAAKTTWDKFDNAVDLTLLMLQAVLARVKTDDPRVATISRYVADVAILLPILRASTLRMRTHTP